MRAFGRYFIYAVIALMPFIYYGHTIVDFEWWGSCVPLWVGLWLRDRQANIWLHEFLVVKELTDIAKSNGKF